MTRGKSFCTTPQRSSCIDDEIKQDRPGKEKSLFTMLGSTQFNEGQFKYCKKTYRHFLVHYSRVGNNRRPQKNLIKLMSKRAKLEKYSQPMEKILHEVPAKYDFMDQEKIALREIRTSENCTKIIKIKLYLFRTQQQVKCNVYIAMHNFVQNISRTFEVVIFLWILCN